MIADEGCWERGCACHDSRDSPGVELVRKREWVGLTEERVYKMWDDKYRSWIGGEQFESIARAIEAKLMERNT